jgi:hypothetical protein
MANVTYYMQVSLDGYIEYPRVGSGVRRSYG